MCARTSTPIRSDSAARAVLARVVAELFAEPDAGWSGRLASSGAADEIRRCAAVLEMKAEPIIGLFAERPTVDVLLDERGRLFGHTVRSACPPYELEYGRGEVFQQSQRLADIAGFYAAFGYQATGPLAERPDHVVAQWEFLSLLALKEAQAPCAETAACCRDAQRLFLREHMAAWLPAFLSRIRKAEPTGFFSVAADFTGDLLAHCCAVFNVGLGPAWMELTPIDESDVSIRCGDDAEPQVELGPTLAAAMGERS